MTVLLLWNACQHRISCWLICHSILILYWHTVALSVFLKLILSYISTIKSNYFIIIAENICIFKLSFIWLLKNVNSTMCRLLVHNDYILVLYATQLRIIVSYLFLNKFTEFKKNWYGVCQICYGSSPSVTRSVQCLPFLLLICR